MGSYSASGLYRPPQWVGPPMVSITVPQQMQQSTQDLSTSSVDLSPSAVGTVTYIFDAVLDLEHEQRLEVTRHPVQTGADISSHAYLVPARLVMAVLMSDTVDQYAAGSQQLDGSGPSTMSTWSGNTSKSVSAYQQMQTLQAARQPLTVVTRLRTYTNMVIASISPREDYKTITGLRMRVEFTEIYTATVATVPNSARSNTTDSSGLGQTGTQPVSSTTQNQFGVPVNPVGTSLTDLTSSLLGYLQSGSSVDVPGAGSYSSTNINNLSTLQAPQ